ncbi:Cytosolic Fe-S cluster assembly factor NAR1 [Termitomyces sp. J132]|nr:Cytosolic Fe-S cluster assembly factor NAR1 [Termitomyces sp. J132]
MAFSGALTLTDLNDFITPSQACIKPVTQTAIQLDRSGAYYEVTQDGKDVAPAPASMKKLEQAQINLNDCLACSGCITSAESVLITLQSHTEVLTFLESNKKILDASSAISSSEVYKIPIISISPQTLASFAAATAASASTLSSPQHPTPRQILRRIRRFCIESLGFSLVFDTTFARHLALQEHVAEFTERLDREKLERDVTNDSVDESRRGLPMLASACPGWICYAEKAHSEMLPLISRTKSPQQVMGTLIKNWMGARWGKGPSEIYHVTVMPCYDKKLEASRKDFHNDMYSTRDVDCVITTGELERLMKENSWDITQPVPGELDNDLPTTSFGAFDPFYNAPYSANHASMVDIPAIHFPELLTHPGSSSGSYLHAIIAHLQATSDVPLTLNVEAVRGTDYEEYILTKNTGEPGNGKVVVFKGAKCYGFRNLQNVVRRVGRERERRYDYVEVMACPGGCVNGGGQLKPVINAPSLPTTDSEGYKRNWEESGVAVAPIVKSFASIDVAQDARWVREETRRRFFRTEYRAVESEVAGLAVVW